jgi:hypothetical protein
MLASRFQYDPTGQAMMDEGTISPVEPALDDLWLHRRLNSLL